MASLGSSNTDRKSTRLNSSHTVIYTLSLHDALPISRFEPNSFFDWQSGRSPYCLTPSPCIRNGVAWIIQYRSEEHTSELQSHSDLHSFPTRRSSDLPLRAEFLLRLAERSFTLLPDSIAVYPEWRRLDHPI